MARLIRVGLPDRRHPTPPPAATESESEIAVAATAHSCEDVVDGLLGEVPPGHLVARHVTGVVDQHVQPAEAVEDLLGHTDHVRVDGDVGLYGERLTADVLDAGTGDLVGCSSTCALAAPAAAFI